jgi:phospholipase A1
MYGWLGSLTGVLSLSVILSGNSLLAGELTPMDACLLEQIKHVDSNISLAELKTQCEIVLSVREPEIVDVEKVEPVPELAKDDPTPIVRDDENADPVLPGESLISRRIQAEKSTRYNPFVLSPHKRNYVLLASYNDTPNYEIYNIPESDFDRVEMKFQLSFKMPVWEGVLGTNADLYVAYSNLSFWQSYNEKISSPFRETVHEPEMFLVLPNDWSIGGWRNSLLQIGAVHQSNGKSGFMSRSWNRVYANFLFEKDKFLIGFKPWHRIEESDDDNPDITDYLGHYELTGIYKGGDHTFSLMLRNLFDGESRDTFQVDWSFPLHRRWRGYVQYFNGYGESMIDYNAESQRIGFGVQLTDWL